MGVGGSLYGRGAHVLLIDDPFSSMADARSEHVRKETWQWFTGTAYNRLEKNGAIVVIGTEPTWTTCKDAFLRSKPPVAIDGKSSS